MHLAMFINLCLVSARHLNNLTLSRKRTVDSLQGDASDYLKNSLEENDIATELSKILWV